VLVVVAAIVLGEPAPLAGLMILWNNLIIDVIPSFALALEPSSDDAMDTPPRPKGEPVLGAGTVRRIVVQGLLVGGVGLTAYLLAGARSTSSSTRPARPPSSPSPRPAPRGVQRPHRPRLGLPGRHRNPYLWGALGLPWRSAVGPLRDLLGLTVLPPTAWVMASGLAAVPLVGTQSVRMWREHRVARDAQ
jgi:P-type Ca2+ transporter type 2C